MEKFDSRSHSPQWHCANFVSGVRGSVLDDTVSGTNIVEQEISIRMKDFVSDCTGHRIVPAVQLGASGHCAQRIYMASLAANSLEEIGSNLSVQCACQCLIPWRSFKRSNKCRNV